MHRPTAGMVPQLDRLGAPGDWQRVASCPFPEPGACVPATPTKNVCETAFVW
jgi:hypothetical protein